MKQKLLFLMAFLFGFLMINSVNAGVSDITLINPPVGNWTNVNTPIFFYNFTSQTSGTGNVTLLINNLRYGSTTDAHNGSAIGQLNITANATVPEGNITWLISITDDANQSNSSRTLNVIRSINITFTSPTTEIWDNDTTPQFNYTVMINNIFGGSPIRNCTLYLGGTQVSNATHINASLANGTDTTIFTSIANARSSGNHSVQINCSTLSQVKNSSRILYRGVDLERPTVIINLPTIGYTYTRANSNDVIRINCTGTDNVINPVCNITIDGVASNLSISATNGTAFTANFSVGDGTYTANCTCIDLANYSNSTSHLFSINTEQVGYGTPVCAYTDIDRSNPFILKCCPTAFPKYDTLQKTCVTGALKQPLPTTTTVKSIAPVGAISIPGIVLPQVVEENLKVIIFVLIWIILLIILWRSGTFKS